MGYFAALISDMNAPARPPKAEAMSDKEAVAAAKKRIDEETRALSPIRRGMKASVANFVEARCEGHPAFARLTLNPKKSMANCFRYINRKAKEVAEREMEDYGLKPEAGVYCLDIPNDLCYSWGVAYFEDPDAPEDRQEEVKPQPHANAAPPKRRPQKPPIDVEQLTLFGRRDLC